MSSVLHEFRHAARAFLKTPGQSILAVAALGLGIGLTSTVFSVVYGTVIKGLPFEGSEHLMAVERRALAGAGERSEGVPTRVHELADWRERQRSFEGLGAFALLGVNLAGSEAAPERVPGALLTTDSLALLRVRPHRGRGFGPGDGLPGSPHVAIIGYALWQGRFGSDPNIVGRSVLVNGAPTTIIGVMARGFAFPLNQSIWLPLGVDPLETPCGQGRELSVFGRLKDGVSTGTARLEFAALTRQLAVQEPDSHRGTTVVIKPYWRRFLGPDAAVPGLYTMLAAVFGVLLVACVNVANLLLARAVVRTKELAVRAALGAGRGRLAAQVLAESAVVALAGGALGLALAWVGIGLFRRAAIDTNPPFWMAFTLSAPVLAFVGAMVIVSALASGLAPALRSSRPNLNEILNDAAHGGSSLRLGRFSRILVTAELALSVALLLPSGSMVRSIVELEARDYGFAIADVLTGDVSLPASAYPDRASWLRFSRELERRLQEGSGVRAAALATDIPGRSAPWTSFEIEGQPPASDTSGPATQALAVTTGFFRTYGVRALQGREFQAADTAETEPVAIVNRRFAERFFPDGLTLGRRIRFIEKNAPPEPWRLVVGVVPDMFLGGREGTRDWGVYVPFAQSPSRGFNLVVRATGDPRLLTPWVRQQVAAIDPGLPVGLLSSMQDVIFRATWPARLFGALFASFGLAALLLAVVGLYGVVSFATGQRSHEIGIRMALGAAPRGVVMLVVRQGLWQLVPGILVGLAGGLVLLRVFMQLDAVPRLIDPLTHSVVLAVLAATTIVAYLVPARRASRTDPTMALRQ